MSPSATSLFQPRTTTSKARGDGDGDGTVVDADVGTGEPGEVGPEGATVVGRVVDGGVTSAPTPHAARIVARRSV
jgi:hypothetical protein